MSIAFVREESAEAAQEVSLPPRAMALSHQPFLLPITWLPIALGTNKFNTLESRQNAAREAFLARCDNATRSSSAILPGKPRRANRCRDRAVDGSRVVV